MATSTERAIRVILGTSGPTTLPRGKGIPAAITTWVISDVIGKVFKTLETHDRDLDTCHSTILIKNIATHYTKIRFHHVAKLYHEILAGDGVRRKYTKLIHFRNQ